MAFQQDHNLEIVHEVQFTSVAHKNQVALAMMESKTLQTTVEAWDQIGSLTSEVATSVMAKQASIMCERFREESSRSNKRRKLDSSVSATAKDLPEQEPSLVTSDEESNAGSDVLSDVLCQQIDRLGRMSKLIMEIEHCHRLLRSEMLAMGDDNEF